MKRSSDNKLAAQTSLPPVQREEIVALARKRWQEAGSPPGRDAEFRQAAEAELKVERENVAQTLSRTPNPKPGTPA